MCRKRRGGREKKGWSCLRRLVGWLTDGGSPATAGWKNLNLGCDTMLGMCNSAIAMPKGQIWRCTKHPTLVSKYTKDIHLTKGWYSPLLAKGRGCLTRGQGTNDKVPWIRSSVYLLFPNLDFAICGPEASKGLIVVLQECGSSATSSGVVVARWPQWRDGLGTLFPQPRTRAQGRAAVALVGGVPRLWRGRMTTRRQDKLGGCPMVPWCPSRKVHNAAMDWPQDGLCPSAVS